MQKDDTDSVVAGSAFDGLFRGEAADGLQGAHGGHEEGFVAGAFRAAGDGLAVVVFLLLGGDAAVVLRALPALHGLAVDCGALGKGKNVPLAGSGAGPAFLDLTEVAGDNQGRGVEHDRDIVVGAAFEVQSFDLGKEVVLVFGDRISFACFFIHVCLVVFAGNDGVLRYMAQAGIEEDLRRGRVGLG